MFKRGKQKFQNQANDQLSQENRSFEEQQQPELAGSASGEATSESKKKNVFGFKRDNSVNINRNSGASNMTGLLAIPGRNSSNSVSKLIANSNRKNKAVKAMLEEGSAALSDGSSDRPQNMQQDCKQLPNIIMFSRCQRQFGTQRIKEEQIRRKQSVN